MLRRTGSNEEPRVVLCTSWINWGTRSNSCDLSKKKSAPALRHLRRWAEQEELLRTINTTAGRWCLMFFSNLIPPLPSISGSTIATSGRCSMRERMTPAAVEACVMPFIRGNPFKVLVRRSTIKIERSAMSIRISSRVPPGYVQLRLRNVGTKSAENGFWCKTLEGMCVGLCPIDEESGLSRHNARFVQTNCLCCFG